MRPVDFLIIGSGGGSICAALASVETNEACSYMETGKKIFENRAVPCWAIMDSRHRNRNLWSRTKPKYTPQEWLSSGYVTPMAAS